MEENLAAVAVLRAQYQQTRYISGLAEPLRSSGSLLLVRDSGLVWRQEVPFQVIFVLTDAMISEQFLDQPRKVKTKHDHGELFTFVGLFSGIFSGDHAALEKAFEVDFVAKNADGWEMDLKPQLANVRRVFSAIKVSGRGLVEDVEIFEASGNRTVIHFSGMTTSPLLLSSDEKRYFEN